MNDFISSTEADLIVAAANGDERGVKELVRRFNRRLYRVARGICGDDASAEDILQDSYLLIFTKIKSFRQESSFLTWATRITINCAVRAKRSERSFTAIDEEKNIDKSTCNVVNFPSSVTMNPYECSGQSQANRILESAIENLPPNHRIAFIMYEVENMSVREIAEALDTSQSAIKTRLFRARRLLRKTLELRMLNTLADIYPFGGRRCESMAVKVIQGLEKQHLTRPNFTDNVNPG
jgi:RNA polymerase sigma-70 factor (ECF subfamily)